MCYVGFFNYDGSPVSNYYPEDGFWYTLTEQQKVFIRTKMAQNRYLNYSNLSNNSRRPNKRGGLINP